jgi:hypothetical protein
MKHKVKHIHFVGVHARGAAPRSGRQAANAAEVSHEA